MSIVTDRYSGLIGYLQQLGAEGLTMQEDQGVLKVQATVQSVEQKNQVWNEIKKIGGDRPQDLLADIRVAGGDPTIGQPAGQSSSGTTGGMRMHQVQPGETLSKIAQQYLGSANRYMDIFNANKGVLTDPDKIQPGQQLSIPNA